MAYHRQQGVDTAIIRIFNTYGPRMRPHDGRAIPTFLRQALQDRPITVFGDGSQTRSLLLRLRPDPRHDRAAGVRRAPPGQRRQPGRVHAARARRDGHRGDRLALGDRLRGAADRRPAGPPARTRRWPQKLLGWKPEVSLREGLRGRSTTPAPRRWSEAASGEQLPRHRARWVVDVLGDMPTTTREDERARDAGPASRRSSTSRSARRTSAASGRPRWRSCCKMSTLRHLARVLSLAALDFAGIWLAIFIALQREGGAPGALGTRARRSTRRRTSSPSRTC